MVMRWRAAMKGDALPPLTGEVEIDETFVGGLEKNKHRQAQTADEAAYRAEQ
jgi:hypothetical protein